jgi:hypothetical protein
LQPTTATLGTVGSPAEVQDLPLNGRNFTQVLDLTPGVSPISVAQNSTATIAQMNHAIGTFTNPSVNGQPNRSNFFLMDGANNNGSVAESVGKKGRGKRRYVEKSRSGTFPLRLEIPQKRRDFHFSHRPGYDG